jgi:glutamate racemase
VEKSVRPLIEAGADTIVLGCTHYPFLAETIMKAAGTPVTLIDPAPAVAKHLMEVMKENGLIRKDGFSMSLHSSGEPGTLKKTYDNLI